MVKPTAIEMQDVIYELADMEDCGESINNYLTYQDGVRDAILWVLGEAENPLELKFDL